MTAHNPEPRRCGVCDTRLSRVVPGHEDRCFRRSHGMPPIEDGDDAPVAARETKAAVAAMEARHGR